MGTATGAETLDSFKEVHCDLDDVHSKIQFSMDCPNVSWKTVKVTSE